MWDLISIIFSISASILIAVVFWNMQKNNSNLKAKLLKKLCISIVSGLIFGLIIYGALNPNQSFMPSLSRLSDDMPVTEEKNNDSSSFKSANGSLKFYSDDPCSN